MWSDSFADDYTERGTVNITENSYAEPIKLKEKPGSDTVIDNQFIYGLKAGMTREYFENNCVSVSGDSFVAYKDTNEILGTGSEICLSGAYEDSYCIVIFGDTTGDGWYDGRMQ